MTEGVMFFHSKCCGAHWEFVFRHGEFRLECEKCGKIGVKMLEVYNPDGLVMPKPKGCECQLCKGRRN